MVDETARVPSRKPWLAGRKVLRPPPSYAGFDGIDSGKRRFLVVGDTQRAGLLEFWRERNEEGRRLLLDEIVRRDPAFVLHLGDLTARGGSRREWERFDALHERFRAKGIPYFPVLGNHEFHGGKAGGLRSFFARFPHLEERRWYSFVWRNVGLILLDSNFGRMSGAESESLSSWYLTQLERLDREPSIDFVIVCSHRPPYTRSHIVRPCARSRERFVEPFLRSRKACFFFSGHAHAYERFQLGGKHFIVSGGGGGPRHRILQRSGPERLERAIAGPSLTLLHACEIEHGAEGLEFRVVKLEGRAFAEADPLGVPRSERVSGIPDPLVN
jgi:hypothetical protein